MSAYGNDAREEYFLSQIFTAPPQKLQLMLIDAALRQTLRRAIDFRAGEFLAGLEPILKAQSIVTEIMAAARQDAENPLGKQIAALYAYLFRELVQAHLKQTIDPLDAVIRVLEEERETWRQVCEKFGNLKAEAPAPHYAHAHITDYDSTETGLSFEA
ncbi:MAG: flagellar protein FliS [Pirellulales bacterium]